MKKRLKLFFKTDQEFERDVLKMDLRESGVIKIETDCEVGN
jgi:hypothetical protein